jgi:diphthamide synthase (EF-2-diphthine--ammonia ligase)
LPESVDPCGEKGEFHTFVSDGPVFTRPVSVCGGEVELRGFGNRFAFCDLRLGVEEGKEEQEGVGGKDILEGK